MKFTNCQCRKVLFIVAVLIPMLIPANAFSLDTFFAGPRAMGMGGANVASVSDTTAQYYNPAAFGFFDCRDTEGNKVDCDNNNIGRKKWGADLNAAGGYRLHNEFGDFIDNLADINRCDLSECPIHNESDLLNLVKLVNDLNGLADPGNAITADVNSGLGVRFNHFALGIRTFFQATGQVVELDFCNLGLGGSDDLNAEINNVSICGNDNRTCLFTPYQQAQLQSAGLDASAIQKLDFLARQEGVKCDDVQGVVNLLKQISIQTITGSDGDLKCNDTTVLLKGFGLAEIPLSYGYAINNHLAIGGNVKLMVGRVYGTEVVVFDKNSKDIIEKADEDYEESINFGVDIGLMARFKMVNLGVVGRNLNSPKFDGPTVNGIKFDDVTIDPQVTVGIAFIPFETLTLEADLDVTKNETTFAGYDTQNLSFGAEWDAFRFLALRAGAYKNLAENDIDWVYTAGLGLNLWAMRIDVAGAFAGEKGQFDDEDIPRELRVAAQVSIDF
jgi:hypothetical protein